MTQDFSTYVTSLDEDKHHITLAVSNVHCASCIRVIENSLAEEENASAGVNMTTERLKIAYEGPKERINHLTDKISTLGYPVHILEKQNETYDSHRAFLLRSLALSGFGMGNLMLLSVALWSADAETMGIATKDLFHWFSAIIGLPIIIFSGRPFFRSAFSVLKAGKTNMDVPISLAIILASTMSFIEVLQKGEYIYFDSALMLIFFLLIGRTLDYMARDKAKDAAHKLLSRLRGYAQCVEGDNLKIYTLDQLKADMIVRVAKGENIPADGTVIAGTSEIDMSLVTGETIPTFAEKGTEVFAGTVNLLQTLDIRVSKSNRDSLLSHIVQLMENAAQSKSRFVRIADKAAALYTPIIHTLGLTTFLFWCLIMGMAWQPALMIAITVLIITCPCALGLAVPVVQILASGFLMKRGILLKSGDALEKLEKISVAIFDKTGTLTIGKPILKTPKIPKEHMQMAASIASHSKHPLSQALVAQYKGDYLSFDHVKEYPGKGLEALYNGKKIKLGNRRWCEAHNDHPHDTALELCLKYDNKTIFFHFTDTLREDAISVIDMFKQNHIKILLLSGDRYSVVKDIAQTLRIQDYQAELSPEEKCNIIKTLRAEGHHILMVGDGLNDAPSLATADIAISPSSAVDIAQNSADIIFQGDMLKPIFTAYKVSKLSYILIKQNFYLAIGYNLFAIPIAVAGYVTPLIAALAMSGSSLIVTLNSFRLHRNDVA
ncbi:MAG: heavy metal translocating P-type ATPase [Pseudomonadota bacterium]